MNLVIALHTVLGHAFFNIIRIQFLIKVGHHIQCYKHEKSRIYHSFTSRWQCDLKCRVYEEIEDFDPCYTCSAREGFFYFKGMIISFDSSILRQCRASYAML